MKNKRKYLILLYIGNVLAVPIQAFAACSEYCEDLAPAVRIVKNGLIPIFQIGIPIALILLGMLDFGKAVMAGKEEEMKKSQSMFIKRCTYAVVIFFVITIVHVAFGLFKTTGTDVSGSEDWLTCYNSVEECTDSYSNGSNKVCYYCPNKSIKYLWLDKNAKSSRNCTIQEGLDQSSCSSMNSKFQTPSGSTKKDNDTTSEEEDNNITTNDDDINTYDSSSPSAEEEDNGSTETQSKTNYMCYNCGRRYKWILEDSAPAEKCVKKPQYSTKEACLAVNDEISGSNEEKKDTNSETSDDNSTNKTPTCPDKTYPVPGTTDKCCPKNNGAKAIEIHTGTGNGSSNGKCTYLKSEVRAKSSKGEDGCSLFGKYCYLNYPQTKK